MTVAFGAAAIFLVSFGFQGLVAARELWSKGWPVLEMPEHTSVRQIWPAFPLPHPDTVNLFADVVALARDVNLLGPGALPDPGSRRPRPITWRPAKVAHRRPYSSSRSSVEVPTGLNANGVVNGDRITLRPALPQAYIAPRYRRRDGFLSLPGRPGLPSSGGLLFFNTGYVHSRIVGIAAHCRPGRVGSSWTPARYGSPRSKDVELDKQARRSADKPECSTVRWKWSSTVSRRAIQAIRDQGDRMEQGKKAGEVDQPTAPRAAEGGSRPGRRVAHLQAWVSIRARIVEETRDARRAVIKRLTGRVGPRVRVVAPTRR